jgi:hypothetical protein
MAHEEIVSYITDRQESTAGKMPDLDQGNDKMVDGPIAEGIAFLYQLYKPMSEQNLSQGYSPEEAFWMQFAVISFSTIWDRNATREVNLSDVLLMYLTIYREEVRPEMPVQEDARFLEVLRQRFGMAEQILHDLRIDFNPRMLLLGRFVLTGNPNVVRQVEAAMMVIEAANGICETPTRIPFKFVKDV